MPTLEPWEENVEGITPPVLGSPWKSRHSPLGGSEPQEILAQLAELNPSQLIDGDIDSALLAAGSLVALGSEEQLGPLSGGAASAAAAPAAAAPAAAAAAPAAASGARLSIQGRRPAATNNDAGDASVDASNAQVRSRILIFFFGAPKKITIPGARNCSPSHTGCSHAKMLGPREVWLRRPAVFVHSGQREHQE